MNKCSSREGRHKNVSGRLYIYIYIFWQTVFSKDDLSRLSHPYDFSHREVRSVCPLPLEIRKAFVMISTHGVLQK